MSLSRRASLAIGGLAASAVMGAYVVGLVTRGRDDVLRALSYNAPIAFMFQVLAADFGVRLATRKSLKTDGWTAVIWAVALVLLFLRLGAKTIEASGH